MFAARRFCQFDRPWHWITVEANGNVKGPIVKSLPPETVAALIERCGAKDAGPANLLFAANSDPNVAAKVLGNIRSKLAQDFDLLEQGVYRFCWITDFPMYEIDETTGQVQFSHNPFSMPQGGLEALNSKHPLEILAYQYDIVCNGIELSSGAVRNHDPATMIKAFAIAGHPPESIEQKFPALYRAFQYGTPPHAGLAPGVDRIVMLLAGEHNIREVIAFPMNQNAYDPLMNAPSEVELDTLLELHLKVVEPPKPA